MSKPMPTAPNQEFQPPANGPPSYDQALNEGAAQPPPGPAQYKPPQQPGSYGGYGPPPGAAYPPQQYGPAPGMPQQQPGMPQQQQQYGQYGAPPGVHQQPQQYGQYGAPPGGVPVVGAVIQTVPYCGPNPTHMVCPQCHAEIDTSVRASPSTTAWVSGLLIALFGCWMGCCLIPCCMDECMDKEHSCPNCHAYLGKHRR